MNKEKKPKEETKKQQELRSSSSIALGIILIILGIFILLGTLFNFDAGHSFWPFFIIIPGVLLFILALFMEYSGENMAIAGAMVTTAGLILLYQNAFDNFESWAYGWALVAPTSIGLGQIVYGKLRGVKETVSKGISLTKTGIALFLVGAAFFELVVGISGFGLVLDRLGWAALLIAVGLIILISGFKARD